MFFMPLNFSFSDVLSWFTREGEETAVLLMLYAVSLAFLITRSLLTEGAVAMDMTELMKSRHSVRRFLDKPLDAGAVTILEKEIEEVNRISGLAIQLVLNEPDAFQAGKPSYGKFSCCRNYIALAGVKGEDGMIGYYGERLVLKAQELGINSCWVAMSFKRKKAKVSLKDGEKLYMVIALGYGESQGNEHKSKELTAVSDYSDGDPEWYRKGLEAALTAPTALNQQKFRFSRTGNRVEVKAGLGFYTGVDLGIVKYHFELGSGKGREIWV